MNRNFFKSLIISFLLFSCICTFANQRERELIEHVKSCLVLAEQEKSQLTEEHLGLHGMSGKKFRHFLNNLCTLHNASYLEIGCWKGSTLVAALYGNASTIDSAIAVDNWSEFESPKGEFLSNINRFISTSKLHFYEQDCFRLDKKTSFPLPVNIYFYDGGHSFLEQEQAFTYFDDVFEDVFIAIIDDWNNERISGGTFSGFAKMNYKVLFAHPIFTEQGNNPFWWNGVYIAVLKKASAN